MIHTLADHQMGGREDEADVAVHDCLRDPQSHRYHRAYLRRSRTE